MKRFVLFFILSGLVSGNCFSMNAEDSSTNAKDSSTNAKDSSMQEEIRERVEKYDKNRNSGPVVFLEKDDTKEQVQIEKTDASENKAEVAQPKRKRGCLDKILSCLCQPHPAFMERLYFRTKTVLTCVTAGLVCFFPCALAADLFQYFCLFDRYSKKRQKDSIGKFV